MKIPNWLSSKIKKLTLTPIVYNKILYPDGDDVLEMLRQKGIKFRWIGFTPEGNSIIEDKIGEKSFSNILKENRRLNKIERNKS